MSESTTPIVCRQCDDVIDADIDNCPNCGKGTQGRGPWYAIVFGVALVVPSVFDIATLWFFGLFGLVLIGIGTWMIRDRRRRIKEAQGRVSQQAENTPEAENPPETETT